VRQAARLTADVTPGLHLVPVHHRPVRPGAAIGLVRLAVCLPRQLPGGSLLAARARPCCPTGPLRLVHRGGPYARGPQLPCGGSGRWRQSLLAGSPGGGHMAFGRCNPLGHGGPGRVALAPGFQLVNSGADSADTLPDLLSAVSGGSGALSMLAACPPQTISPRLDAGLAAAHAAVQLRRVRSGPGLRPGPHATELRGILVVRSLREAVMNAQPLLGTLAGTRGPSSQPPVPDGYLIPPCGAVPAPSAADR